MARSVKYRLLAHAQTPATDLSLGVKVTLVGSDVLKLEYVMIGAIDRLRIPGVDLPEWQDELWRHTCCELFVRRPDGGYVEYNFSPSRHHAIYRFEGYRLGMQPALDLKVSGVYVERGERRFALDVWVDLRRVGLDAAMSLGLSAVIEAKDGTKSYWALAHAPGPPDFHNPACFIATLPAPDAA